MGEAEEGRKEGSKNVCYVGEQGLKTFALGEHYFLCMLRCCLSCIFCGHCAWWATRQQEVLLVQRKPLDLKA